MIPLVPRALLLLALAGSLRAGQIEAPVSGQAAPGSQSGAIGSSLGAPVPVQMTVPSLTGAAPSLALAPAPAPVFLQPSAAPAAAVPVQAAVAVQAAAPALPALPVSAVTPAGPAALAEAPRAAASAPDSRGEEAGLAEGAALFDQAKPSFWSALRDKIPFGERFPAWPGKAGDVLRVGRLKTTLGSVAGEGGTSKVWKTADGNYAVKLLHPGARGLPGVKDEAAILRALEKTDLPVAKLRAESPDSSVLVKEYIEGATAHELLERGALSRSQSLGWPELAAKLISAGVTADLARGNLVWQHWRTRWVIVDAGSLSDGGPRAVLDQMMAPELLSRAGIDGADFLAGLRARLGPDSAKWSEVLAGLRGSKAAAAPLAALAARDAARPAAPRLVFGPA
ncbi:MAG: hypothetical protein NDJ72_11385, partial [Elusimicrobia bacterium]|nr:hypothetical protein [Elusimicrobiota bacterium]